MRTAIYLIAFFVVCTLGFAQTDTPPYLTKTFNASSIKTLHVQTSGGSISVSGQEGEAKVEVYVKPNSWNGLNDDLSTKQIEERLANYDLIINIEGNILKCIAKKKKDESSDWKRSLSISFKITVPPSISSDLNTSGGSIKLTNLSGNQRFKTSGGSLKLSRLRGNIMGRTSGGSIHVSDSHDDISLTTSGGSITAERSTGKLYLKTSGGSIQLEGINGVANANTSGGSIKGNDIKGELIANTSAGSIKLEQVNAALKASTSGGSIKVEVLNVDKYLNLSTSAGGITVQMPMEKGLDLDLRGQRVNLGVLNNFDGSIEKDVVKGKLNGGGIPVHMRASSGSISISK